MIIDIFWENKAVLNSSKESDHRGTDLWGLNTTNEAPLIVFLWSHDN
jgi:hypothetical protein